MGASFGACCSGTFVITWAQTDVDGLDDAPLRDLTKGAAWSWRGDVVRMDGPNSLLRLENPQGSKDLRRRAARVVHRLVGQALDAVPRPDASAIDMPLMDRTFTVTDGAHSHIVTLIETGADKTPLLMFTGSIPPRDTEMWVVDHTLTQRRTRISSPDFGGVICFSHDTRILTPNGPRLVQDLVPGDRVSTKDDGPQPIQWIGARHMSGARLYAMPGLRPIRISSGALGIDRPHPELLVSPEHRLLVHGDVARALFNTPEVLVPARDLVNDDTISRDLSVRHVTYVHLLLERHQVIWANGVETESFHPASAALTSLEEADRARLLALHPGLDDDPHTYGSFARRNLTPSEAALLQHAA